MATLKINVNATTRTVELDDPGTPLLYVLRDRRALAHGPVPAATGPRRARRPPRVAASTGPF